MRFAVLVSLLLAANVLLADVLDAAPSGFTVQHRLLVDARRQAVYDAAVQRVGEWWSDAHTVSGDAGRLQIDARPLGCFCEVLGPGAGVVHMTVTLASPGVMLRLTGGLGPLGLHGVSGNMTWEFDDRGEQTLVTWSYAVGGYLAEGLDQLAPAVDEVLQQQMIGLKTLVEAEHGEE